MPSSPPRLRPLPRKQIIQVSGSVSPQRGLLKPPEGKRPSLFLSANPEPRSKASKTATLISCENEILIQTKQYFFFLTTLLVLWDLSSLTRCQTQHCSPPRPCPQWKHRVLTTGPPGNSLSSTWKKKKKNQKALGSG